MTVAIPRLFVLRRDRDITGVSGPGDVADGVQWADGSVVIRWRARPSTAVWDSLDMMLSVHGHDGATHVVWTDEPEGLVKTAVCEDCLRGAHGPNHHRRHQPPARVDPVERCGELLPIDIGPQRTECVLRPGHSGSHADDHGCRWWITPEPPDWRRRAEQAEQRRDQLADTLRQVLGAFTQSGHPGLPCLRTSWTSVKTVDRWRAVLRGAPTSDQHSGVSPERPHATEA